MKDIPGLTRLDQMRSKRDRSRAVHEESQEASSDNHQESDTQAGGPKILPPPSAPMEVARLFIAECCTAEEGITLRYWRAGWWMWRQSHWIEVDNRAVRSVIYMFTEHALYPAGVELRPWDPTTRKITDVLDALTAICFLRSDFDQPGWLKGNEQSSTIVAVANGLLDVERRMLLPHTPNFFNQTAVPFAYDPLAPPPRKWLEFLGELWPDEPDAIDLLAQWCGYVISGRTDLHKILLMVGPTRGGKGAIARILVALVGRGNVAGPTLNSLSGEFGLAPLIGKALAVISDARFSGKDASVVVERLLSISGEDTLTVNRKYRDQWTGKLPSRIHVLSNELPKLGDASTAIVGRIILLPLSRSWLGKEDHALEPRLQTELAGILNWTLDGLQSLVATDNRFIVLPSAEEAINVMRDLASPVGAFVRDCCILGPNQEIKVDALYKAYKGWAEDNGHPRVAKSTFGHDLRAVAQSVRVTRRRDQNRATAYAGINLNAEIQEESQAEDLL
jgi:putative DNA primase/helicase